MKTNPMLSTAERILAGVAGFLLLLTAGLLVTFPPKRREIIVETPAEDRKLVQRVADTHFDSPTVLIALFISGAVLVGFSINGLRVFEVDAGGSKVSAGDQNREITQQSTAGSNEEPARLAAAFNEWTRNYLRLSSYMGLKVLKAATISAAKKKNINLKTIAGTSGHLSYDYLYGFTIACTCAGIMTGTIDPTSGEARIISVHPIVTDEIDAIIAGNLAIEDTSQDFKKRDMAELSAYLEKL